MRRSKPEQLVEEAEAEVSEVKLAKATGDVASLKKRNKKIVAAAIESEKRLEALLAIQGEPAEIKFSKMARSKPDGVAVICPLSDWHVEEQILAAAVNGKNNFNLSEAEKRIKRLFSKIVELTDWYGKFAPVAEIWMPLLGDLLTGEIHEELMETNALSPTQTCVFLRDQICGGIDFLLKETKLPVAVPCCYGNHGRTTQKMRIKTSSRNSYEWLLAKTLQKIYEKNKRVAFMISEGYHNTQMVMGRRIRFHHGDGIRFQGGVGGLFIPANKAVAQWDLVEQADLDIFGHYHAHTVCYPKWICCGSLAGYSEFALSIKAPWQFPTQAFIVVDRNYGLVHAEPIFLTNAWRKQKPKESV